MTEFIDILIGLNYIFVSSPINGMKYRTHDLGAAIKVMYVMNRVPRGHHKRAGVEEGWLEYSTLATTLVWRLCSWRSAMPTPVSQVNGTGTVSSLPLSASQVYQAFRFQCHKVKVYVVDKCLCIKSLKLVNGHICSNRTERTSGTNNLRWEVLPLWQGHRKRKSNSRKRKSKEDSHENHCVHN
jgi:hypothetical protein